MGVDGCNARGVNCRGEVGEPKLAFIGDGLVSTPIEFTSKPSLSTTVPSARKACSKSKSVRDTRRCNCLFPFKSPEATGIRPEGYAVRGVAWVVAALARNMEARMGKWFIDKWRT